MSIFERLQIEVCADIELMILKMETHITNQKAWLNELKTNLAFNEMIEAELQAIGDVELPPLARMLVSERKCLRHVVGIYQRDISICEAQLRLMEIELRHLKLWRDDVKGEKHE